ncbi:hypothetical protein PDJAM_G00256400 [Pangasius djambal]|uniref:Uncharacterized protein n=1 Tax=Pangasius djambal TaxID=1691987 RepID=A0ACC5YKB3_9TELE|nr:hypothetical protein [Pangasius djambal]
MAPLAEEYFSSLQLLLKAPSKDVVRQICMDSFPSRAHESQSLVDSTARALSVSSGEAMQVLTAFHTLSHHVVFHNFTAPEQIQSIFPATFHSNLKNLLTKILLEQSVTWRNEALSSQSEYLLSSCILYLVHLICSEYYIRPCGYTKIIHTRVV